MSAKVSSESVPPSTGVAAEGTFEGLLPGVELDVTEQVALLGERGATLIALKRPLTCKEVRANMLIPKQKNTST